MDQAAMRQAGNGQDSALMLRIAHARAQLSDSRRQLLDGILDSLDETVFLSSRELATRFGTDAATIVRTTQALGYGQFAEFARDLRSHFLAHVNPYRIMAREVTGHRGAAFHVQACLQRDLDNVRAAAGHLDPAAVAAAGARLYRARHIVVVAGDLDFMLAE